MLLHPCEQPIKHIASQETQKTMRGGEKEKWGWVRPKHDVHIRCHHSETHSVSNTANTLTWWKLLL